MTGRLQVAAAVIAACMFASGCSTLPPVGAQAPLSGRLALQIAASGAEPARSVSASFELQGDAQRGQLQLSSPLGTVMAQARWQPGQVLLKSAEGEQRFADLPSLAEQVLGEPLPMAALIDWMRGRPWVGAPHRPLVAPAQGFEQLGWTVDLERFGEGGLSARRSAPPAVTLRARLER